MKKFPCDCINKQFKCPAEVYVDFIGEPGAELLCAYRPKGRVTLRRVKLAANFCPQCGAKLKDV